LLADTASGADRRPEGARGTLVWLQRDLRLADNPALLAAAQRGGPVIPVFVWAPEEEGGWAPGAASRWWLHQSLASLAAELEACGSRLILRRGSSRAVLEQVLAEAGADAVFWSRRTEPALAARDERVRAHLAARGITAAAFAGQLLFEPDEVRTQAGTPFQVFTPFWKACQALPPPLLPTAAPVRLPGPQHWPDSLPLERLQLEPRPEWSRIDWAAGFRAAWRPGTAGAGAQLQRFLEDAARAYPDGRNRPAEPGTSRLSPHLHFGEISPRQVWHAVRLWARKHRADAAANVYLAELGWREFAHHLLHHFPHTTDEPLRPAFTRFPWADDGQALEAWQRGRTGYPLVDAGMRQLWATGWMHNRIRMVTASFLVKDLLLPWQLGAKWFWDTLVDADLANNTVNWQWTAGCGADASPYVRVFNPSAQGERFDADGTYIRRWVPELRGLPSPWAHRPWEAPADVLAAAGVVLGQTYPRPIVDHAVARTRALDAFAAMNQSARGAAPEETASVSGDTP
jgi:deoxyribodipyrimidine photo-lyase